MRLAAPPTASPRTTDSGVNGAPKLVVGVSGSPRSDDALALAVTIKRVLHAELLLAHAQPFGKVASLLQPSKAQRRIAGVADASFRTLRGRLHGHLELELRLLSDRSPVHALQRLTEKEQAVALVIGSSHRGRVGRVCRGGIGKRLLSSAICPLVIAPPSYARRESPSFATIGCAFDGSDESRLAARASARIAEAADAALVLIAVHERLSFSEVSVSGGVGVYESANSVLREYLRTALDSTVTELGDGAKVEALFREGSRRQTLTALSEYLDLLVSDTRVQGPESVGHTGSIARSLMRDARCPVMLIPARASRAMRRASQFAADEACPTS